MIGWSAEYLITTAIAQELYKVHKQGIDGIFVEYDIFDLVKENNGKVPKTLRRGRCDICIEFENDLQAIIEVKNTISQKGKKLNSIFKDIKRIEYFLLNDISFEKSYVCFIAGDAPTKEKLINKVDTWFNEIKNAFTKLDFCVSVIAEEHITEQSDIIHWATVVAEISSKPLEKNN
ncbi:hypothetical protein [Sulfurovum sp.]|uniref:hypothetical protein n=1 Tax=Sulfurovum sp. TaxID=1969726 RepID=UPI00356B3080